MTVLPRYVVKRWAAPSAASSKCGDTTTILAQAASSTAPHSARLSMAAWYRPGPVPARVSVGHPRACRSPEGPPDEAGHPDGHEGGQRSDGHHEADPRLDMRNPGGHQPPQPLTDIGHGIEG